MSIANHQDIVARVKAESPTDAFSSVDRMLAFVLRVIAALPKMTEPPAGLVKSFVGAENTAMHGATPVRVNRVIYPDGQIIKILTDSGVNGVNGPAWNADDVRPDLYVSVAATPDPPPPTDIDARLLALEERIKALEDQTPMLWKTLVGIVNKLADRLTALENAPPPIVELPPLIVKGNTSRVWGHAHAIALEVVKREPE